MDNRELKHFGIPGMKWGVRTNRGIKSSTKSAKRKTSEDVSEVYKIKNKSIKQMSNTELRKVNERLNLEQSYSRLNPSQIKKGMALVAGAAAVMNTTLNLYNNSDRLIKLGKSTLKKFG